MRVAVPLLLPDELLLPEELLLPDELLDAEPDPLLELPDEPVDPEFFGTATRFGGGGGVDRDEDAAAFVVFEVDAAAAAPDDAPDGGFEVVRGGADCAGGGVRCVVWDWAAAPL